MFTQTTALLILLMGIQLVRSGQLNGVFLALLVLATMACFEAVQPLAASFQQVSSSLAAARRLFVLVDAEPATQDSQRPLPMPQRQSELVVEHLRFRYSDEEPYVLLGCARDSASRCLVLVARARRRSLMCCNASGITRRVIFSSQVASYAITGRTIYDG